MVVTNTRSSIMKNLIHSCQQKLSSVKFVDSGSFYWSPQTKTIHYSHEALETVAGQWALLHEAGHAKLNHLTYMNDVGLLGLEVAAWQAAEKLAKDFSLNIDADHIQECLNTYRDWLYARSTCPTCELNSLQVAETEYVCLNCSTQWFVSQSRFCRPYRRLSPSMTKSQASNPKQIPSFK